MALHPDFPSSPYAIPKPDQRWFPASEDLRITAYENLGEIVREIDELAVFNDEAHHVHDERMAWFKSIQDIHHRMLQKDGRLSLQIDVTATPKHNNGAIFTEHYADYLQLGIEE